MGDRIVGTTIGRWRVVRVIGRGSTAVVYEAVHPTIASRVALKLLDEAFAVDEGMVARFVNEARAANRVRDEGVVEVFDAGCAADGRPYLAMELLEGRALSTLEGARPLAELGPIALQIAQALGAAHARGIVHRDVKPGNVFLVERGRRANVVKLVDFGFAKLLYEFGERTKTGTIIGTPSYMAPEQARGEVSRITPATDVYALGVVMFRLATGRVPFLGGLGEVLEAHVSRAPPSLRELEASVREDFEALVLRCLAKDPDERPRSMSAVADELGAILERAGVSREPPSIAPARCDAPTDPDRTRPAGLAAPTLQLDRPVAPPRRRGRSPAAIALAVFVAVVLPGLALLLARTRRATSDANGEVASHAIVHVTIVSTPTGARLVVEQGSRRHDARTPATLALVRGVPATGSLSSPGHVGAQLSFAPESDGELRYVLAAEPPAVTGPPAPPRPKRLHDRVVDVEF